MVPASFWPLVKVVELDRHWTLKAGIQIVGRWVPRSEWAVCDESEESESEPRVKRHRGEEAKGKAAECCMTPSLSVDGYWAASLEQQWAEPSLGSLAGPQDYGFASDMQEGR